MSSLLLHQVSAWASAGIALATSIAYFTRARQVVENFRSLGYPDYLPLLLGAYKPAGLRRSGSSRVSGRPRVGLCRLYIQLLRCFRLSLGMQASQAEHHTTCCAGFTRGFVRNTPLNKLDCSERVM